jgi:hypothetical protein
VLNARRLLHPAAYVSSGTDNIVTASNSDKSPYWNDSKDRQHTHFHWVQQGSNLLNNSMTIIQKLVRNALIMKYCDFLSRKLSLLCVIEYS